MSGLLCLLYRKQDVMRLAGDRAVERCWIIFPSSSDCTSQEERDPTETSRKPLLPLFPSWWIGLIPFGLTPLRFVIIICPHGPLKLSWRSVLSIFKPSGVRLKLSISSSPAPGLRPSQGSEGSAFYHTSRWLIQPVAPQLRSIISLVSHRTRARLLLMT